jgi:hypothetical protein
MSVPVRRSPNDTDDAEAGPTGPRLRVSFPEKTAKTRRRLVRLLVAKAALDLVFVSTLAFGTGHIRLGARFAGRVEHAGPRAVRGHLKGAAGPVEVQLFLDGRFAASALAAEGGTEGQLSFVFRLDPPRADAREARVFAVEPSREGSRRALHPLGGPVPLADK